MITSFILIYLQYLSDGISILILESDNGRMQSVWFCAFWLCGFDLFKFCDSFWIQLSLFHYVEFQIVAVNPVAWLVEENLINLFSLSTKKSRAHVKPFVSNLL